MPIYYWAVASITGLVAFKLAVEQGTLSTNGLYKDQVQAMDHCFHFRGQYQG